MSKDDNHMADREHLLALVLGWEEAAQRHELVAADTRQGTEATMLGMMASIYRTCAAELKSVLDGKDETKP